MKDAFLIQSKDKKFSGQRQEEETGHKDAKAVSSRCHSDPHYGHSLGPVSGKDTGFQRGIFRLENAPGFKHQTGRLILQPLSWRQARDSRFFRLFQRHRMEATMRTRRMTRSARKPGKMLVVWPFFLGGKPSGHASGGHRIWAWGCWRRLLSGDRAQMIPGRKHRATTTDCPDGQMPLCA